MRMKGRQRHDDPKSRLVNIPKDEEEGCDLVEKWRFLPCRMFLSLEREALDPFLPFSLVGIRD